MTGKRLEPKDVPVFFFCNNLKKGLTNEGKCAAAFAADKKEVAKAALESR